MDMAEQGGVVRFEEPTSVGAQLHRHLRMTIIRGELRPGQALSEAETSKRYAVSRQPVREAFIKLAEERLVEVVPQRGTFVRKISVNEVMDARFVREVIEVAIAEETANSHDPALVRELRRLLALQQQVSPDDNQSFVVLDDEFHKTLAFGAGREYAWRVIEGIKAQMDRVRYLSVSGATPVELLVRQHMAIVDAVEAGDPIQAADAVRTHMREILRSLPAIAAQNPDVFIRA